jgi:WD40 repeat protein
VNGADEGESAVSVWDCAAEREIFGAVVAGSPTAIELSPDGSEVAVATRAGAGGGTAITRWTVVGQQPMRLNSTGLVSSMAFSPDGRTLVALIDIKPPDHDRIEVWNMGNGSQISAIDLDSKGYAMAISPDGMLAVGGDPRIQVFDLERRQLLATLWGHKGPVKCLTFHPSGMVLMSAADDDTVRLWDWQTLNEVSRSSNLGASSRRGVMTSTMLALDSNLASSGGSALILAFDRSGHVLVTGSRDGTLSLWDGTPEFNFQRRTYVPGQLPLE